MPLTDKQLEQLFKEINPSRVKQREGKFSYVETYDDIAHMIRIFGFGGWDNETTVDLIFEQERGTSGKWDVAYKGRTRLIVRDLEGAFVCAHDGVATGSAQNQSRVEAHDLALKAAGSDSLKRAAIHLGNQFGLSLYNNGSLKSVVGTSLAYKDKVDENPVDPQVIREQVAAARDKMLGERPISEADAS